jgi:hypothetical protein
MEEQKVLSGQSSSDKNPYHSILLHLIPRILTNLDRDIDSPTCGCFDRNFWHYKVHDYSSGLLQQCSLTLALIYLNPFKGNIYWNNPIIQEYSISGVNYCYKIQNRDGSFSEYWKGESSIPSTAFTLYSLCETCELLGIGVDAQRLDKAVQFLIKHRERDALNQEMASIAAIRYAAKLLKNEKYEIVAGHRFDELLKMKKPEGWFSEYGGLDISYLTVTLDFMIRYYELSGNNNALETAKQIVDFIQYFIHPDGSLGGEYGTRNTEYFAPYGIEYLKKHCPISNLIIRRILGYIHQDGYLNMNCDERYYLHYLSHSFMKSLLLYSDNPCTCSVSLPHEKNFEKFFDESKIFIKSTPHYYFITNLSKGGVFKVMNKHTSQMSTDCGYRLRVSKDWYVTELPQQNNYSLDKNHIELTCGFSKMNFIKQSTTKLLLLRIISSVLGFQTNHLLKKMMIFGTSRNTDMTLNRVMTCEDDEIQISDTIKIGKKSGILKLSNGLSMRHTASSRFFQINVLHNSVEPQEFQIAESLIYKRTISFDNSSG